MKLKGEAFFDVKHDESNPFVVEAADLKIEDVGTSFNVKAKESSDVIIISVVSGEVKVTTVSGPDAQPQCRRRSNLQHYNKSHRKKEVIKENISAYSDKVFVFENAELGTVINVLNDVYDVQLGLANMDLKSCRITVTFEDEPIDDIAFVIAETLGLEIKKRMNKLFSMEKVASKLNLFVIMLILFESLKLSAQNNVPYLEKKATVQIIKW
ncbi:MAG: DUF4974 domain-containing protein [Saprospiraceae bacterium]|nr:DUF4974 domain-containing protein [Candidatus Brachybacter algidus]